MKTGGRIVPPKSGTVPLKTVKETDKLNSAGCSAEIREIPCVKRSELRLLQTFNRL